MATRSDKGEKLFQVRFSMKDEKEPWEVTAKSVYPSDFMGLITIEDFVFRDQTKMVILPEEDQARKRFGKTEKLHIPYHQLIFIEEVDEDPADVKNLPFVRAVEDTSPDSPGN